MGWFSSKCPVNDEEKAWLEEATSWLIAEFTLDYVRSLDVILPNETFFPDTYLGREQDVRVLFRRVCSYFDIDPDSIILEFYSDHQAVLSSSQLVYQTSEQKAPAGYFSRDNHDRIIGIEASQFNNPASVIATMAHELSHVVLIDENYINPGNEDDHEFLTDLATVFLGFGVFTANSVFEFKQWRDTFSQGWSAQRKGYLSEEMFGYALAIFAHARKENNPAWSKSLNRNVRSFFKESQKFISNNGLNLYFNGQQAQQ